MSRVTNDFRSITIEKQWYVLVSQVNSCFVSGRGTVPTRAENQRWSDSMLPPHMRTTAGNDIGSSSNVRSGSSSTSSSSQVEPGTGAGGAAPYYSRLNDKVLELYLDDWPAHWSESEILRVYQDLHTITDENEWYSLINQIKQCYRSQRGTVPTLPSLFFAPRARSVSSFVPWFEGLVGSGES